MPLRLTLLSRSYCHLCDDMLAAIRSVEGGPAIDVEIIDVDADEALARQFGEDVPVLLHRGREIARHRLDPQELRRFLAQTRPEI